MSATAAASAAPDRHEMVRRALDLAPTLLERAPETERLRQVHPDTVRDLWDTRLMEICKPARYGGLELDYATTVEIPAALARGCASTAWVYANLIIHDWMLAMWPAEAQEEVWARNPPAMIASSLIYPQGKAVPVDGGYKLSGQWQFCSGIDASEWMMMGAMVLQDGGPPKKLMLVIRTSDLEQFDTWHVAGLVGTGSRDAACKDLFVPEHMTLDPMTTRGGPTPGSDHVPSLVYQLPVLGLFPHLLVGPVLGIAESAYEHYVNDVREKVSLYNQSRLAEHQTIQLKVAEAGVLIRAARMLAVDNCWEATRIAEAGNLPTLHDKVRWRRDGAWAGQSCIKAMNLIYSAVGAVGNYLDNPMQRRFRDMHAAASQIQISFDINGAEFGRVELGLEPINKGI